MSSILNLKTKKNHFARPNGQAKLNWKEYEVSKQLQIYAAKSFHKVTLGPDTKLSFECFLNAMNSITSENVVVLGSCGFDY